MFEGKKHDAEYFKNKIFVGLVEDVKDPNKKGRIKVRVQGAFNELPLEDIPYASPFRSLDGKVFSVPAVGKIVNVIFEQGNIYDPYYMFSENYNVNLQNKLKGLSDDEYKNFVALLFDDRTQIYSDDDALKLDYYNNSILLRKNNIDIRLKDNSQKLHLGHEYASESAVLGDHFMTWMDTFIAALLTPSTLVDSGGIPISKPQLDIIMQQYQSMRETFLSKHVKVVDNNAILQTDYDTNRKNVPSKDDFTKINSNNILKSDDISDNTKNIISDNRKYDITVREETKPNPNDKPAPISDNIPPTPSGDTYISETDRILNIIDNKPNDEYIFDSSIDELYGRSNNDSLNKSTDVNGADYYLQQQDIQKNIDTAMNTDPYGIFWSGDYQIDSNTEEDPIYGSYTEIIKTNGTNNGISNNPDNTIPDLSTLKPSILPTNWNDDKVMKLMYGCIQFMNKSNYVIYWEKWKLNMVGIRTPINKNINKFNDLLLLWWFEEDEIPGNIKSMKSKVKFRLYRITTVPGKTYRINGFEGHDCGYLKEGQYLDYHIGLHQKKYTALCGGYQHAWRSKKGKENLTPDYSSTGKFGMNIHKSSYNQNPNDSTPTININDWSAGCHVFQVLSNFTEYMSIVNKSKNIVNSNKFTYTLVAENDISQYLK